jgi:hypothetical protein
MAYTFSDDIISDLHKDAYGFRPAQRFFDDWNTYSDDEKQECWDTMIKDMMEAEEQQENLEAEALNTFRALVRKTMDLTGSKWYTAVRYLCEAEGEDPNCSQGLDYFLWKHDLGYGDRAVIRKLYKETV